MTEVVPSSRTCTSSRIVVGSVRELSNSPAEFSVVRLEEKNSAVRLGTVTDEGA
jgi:hypothetical protein